MAHITIYKPLVHPHIGYDDIIYEQVCKKRFHTKPESYQMKEHH